MRHKLKVVFLEMAQLNQNCATLSGSLNVAHVILINAEMVFEIVHKSQTVKLHTAVASRKW